MKNINIIIILFFLLSGYSLAQEVIWADEVYDVSSEYNWSKYPFAYKANTILGEPNVLPGRENETKLSWSPKEKNGGIEFIEVGFSHLIKPSQIIIIENFNPGAVKNIEFINEKGERVFQLSERRGFKNKDISKPLILPFPKTSDFIKRVRLTLNTGLVQGYNSIDAIGLSEEIFPYEVKINLASEKTNEFRKELLSQNVNSRADELLPQITPDGKSLYFTRDNHPRNYGFTHGNGKQDIWLSEMDEQGYFQPAVRLGKPINNEYNNSLCSISPDGQKALLMNVYHRDGTMDKGISFSIKKDETWSFPEPITIENYYNQSIYGEYYVSASGRVLMMSVQRNDSYGLKDIYVSFLKKDNTWTKPKNLGRQINTLESEVSPFLAADEKSLYFSSSGFVGYGGHDIYVTRRLDSTWTNWSRPQNLGPAINTPGFDAYYSIPASGEFAYFSSTNGRNRQDIYRIRLQKEAKPKPVVLVKGNVFNKKTNEPIAASILYESLSTGKEIGEARSKSSDGYYSIVLPAGDKYGFRAQAKGYAAISQNVDLSDLENYEEIKRDLYLVPLEQGQIIRLNNVFFEYNKTDINKEANLDLNRLFVLMNEYPNMIIEIAGHTDDVGSTSFNENLSKKRAKAVYKYLLDKGISKKRLSYKGYGESKPIDTNETDEGRALNRRVEFKIVKL